MPCGVETINFLNLLRPINFKTVRPLHVYWYMCGKVAVVICGVPMYGLEFRLYIPISNAYMSTPKI